MFSVHEHRTPMLKAKDLVVLLKLVALNGQPWTYRELASSLGMSVSSVHSALQQAADSHLYHKQDRRPVVRNLNEVLVHGVRYVYPVTAGAVTRGIPTAHGTSPMIGEIRSPDLPPVWPTAEGDTRGYGLEPLHPSVPEAVRQDPALHELLALVDALRIGRAREQKRATELLSDRLGVGV